MRRVLLPVLAAATAIPASLSAGPATGAQTGKPGTPAWAQCVWRLAPVSAKNWLGMKAPAWTDNMASQSELLGHRLIATCSSDAAKERKPNRNPNWSGLRAALNRARPATAGDADAGEPATLLCLNHIAQGGLLILFRTDVVRVAGGKRTTVFQQHFGHHEGRMLRIPQDIRNVPAADAEISTICRSITSAGEPADA